MQSRNFGTLGQPVSEVGLGCWQFGGDFGPMSDAQALAIMSAAVDSGVDFFDTADVYGGGRSESLIGQFLATHRGNPIRVITKFGRDGSVFPDKYTEAALRSAVHAACQRLGVTTLDCLQLHCIPLDALRKCHIFDWVRSLKADGVIREFGASVESVEEGLLCLGQEGLVSLQVIFNLFRQKLVTDLFPQAQKAGVSIIVRLPLASGLLSGKFTQQTTFTAGDHRNYNRDGQAFNVGETFAGLPFETGVELANEIRVLLPQEMTMSQAALRWILDHDAVTTIIPGASSPAQVTSNAAVSNLPRLSGELHSRLSEFYHSKVAQHIRGPY
ncbi:MAG: aldo/keto reductase [Planctomycetales bacterium]|nr:aldo/keto reductase [Planctomycetales bacterium]